MRKKGLTYRLLVMALASVLILAACGGDDGSGDEASSDAAEDAAGSEDPFRVAIILPGRADDFGYSQLGADALKRIEDEMGAETAIAESVAVDQQVETFRDFASQGYDLVTGWGGQYEDGAKQVSEEFPDVYFTVFAGEGGNGRNYSSTFLNVEQWEFLVGYVDANVTKSNKIGQIAGPCFAGTAWEVHGVEQGVDYAAEELGKEIEVKTVSLESFDDPAAAKEAALALIDEGADVLHVGLNTGNLGVFEAAKERDVLVSTQFFDQSDEDPEHILTSSVQPSTEPLVVAAQKVVDGSFDGEPIRVPITPDEDGIADFNGLAPNSLYNETKQLQEKIASGEITVEADGSCPY